LQEYLQKKGEALPLYTIMKEETNNQIKKFNIMCSLEDLNLSIEAEGNTRKKAEIKAAEKMLELIERKND
jgi:ribonuclease-3